MERHQPMNMTVQFYHHMETIKVYFSVSIEYSYEYVIMLLGQMNLVSIFFNGYLLTCTCCKKKKNSKP